VDSIVITPDVKVDPTPAPAANIVQTPTGVQITPAPAAEPRPAWLPDKFKTAADMVASYKELETKLGTPKAADGAPAAVTPPAAVVPVVPVVADPAAAAVVAKAGLDMAALSKEFTEKGVLSAESLAALAKAGVGADVVSSYVAGQKAVAAQMRSAVAATVGGEENLKAVLAWAPANLDAATAGAYNKALASGDTALVSMAVAAIATKYNEANGTAPALITKGEPAPSAGDFPGFKSNAEVVAAMQDKRYAKDESYRQGVMKRLENTK
jgi:hypothetical protein